MCVPVTAAAAAPVTGTTGVGWLLGAGFDTLGMGGVLRVSARNPWPDQRSNIEAPPVFSTRDGAHPQKSAREAR